MHHDFFWCNIYNGRNAVRMMMVHWKSFVFLDELNAHPVTNAYRYRRLIPIPVSLDEELGDVSSENFNKWNVDMLAFHDKFYYYKVQYLLILSSILHPSKLYYYFSHNVICP